MDNLPEGIIPWLRWDERSLDLIAQKAKPVLLFVSDPNSAIAPFLRALLEAMPRNTELRRLLREQFLALFIEHGSLPEQLASYGAGSAFHVAVLSPSGLTPICTIDPVHEHPDEVAGWIVEILNRLVGIW